MSTATERLAVIKQNYDDAANNEAADLAHARTTAQVAAIQANVATARSLYFGALEETLSKAGAGIEAAYRNAVDAQKQIADARTQAAATADLLGKLADGTAKAKTLLDKAKQVKVA